MQFVETGSGVARPLPETLTREDQLALFVDFIAERFDKPGANCFGQTRRVRHIPKKRRLGTHFVDILSPRSATPGKAPLKFGIGYRERGCDNRHDTV